MADSDITDTKDPSALETRICLVGEDTYNDNALKTAVKELGFLVVHSKNGREYTNDAVDEYDTVFVFHKFEGPDYDYIRRLDYFRIMGPPALLKCAKNNEPLPCNTRPLYCTLMSQLIVCFTGFRNKEEITQLVNLVHHMGGSIRKDFSTRVTHLVANSTNGNKYRTAVCLGTPVMTEQWVHKSWSRRDDISSSAVDEDMMQYKMMPLFCCCLSFLGFSDDEKAHMEEITEMQGGTFAPVGDYSCTHLVIDDSTVKELPFEHNSKIYIVKAEWFWASIQMAACADESLYQFEKPASPSCRSATPVTPSRSRKRRRLRESIAALTRESEQNDSPYIPPLKRRSSEVGRLSASFSFIDASHTPDSSTVLAVAGEPAQVEEAPKPIPVPAPPPVILSKRQQIVMELLQTENNYVGILHTIVKVFKEPLEVNPAGGPILAAEDIKTIFGKIPDIHDVHVKLRDDLADLMASYSDDKSVGEIILRHSNDMMKAYPPFVNYFEMTKETLQRCDRQKPRFHAFLKICQSKPECGRQTLAELLIRPVQRLPSIILLLQDLLKRTDKNNSDCDELENAVAAIKEVTKHINEDKRKTEGHTTMFDIINDIEGVPAHLLSSHRSFIMKCDTIEIGDRDTGKGDSFGEKGGNVTLFLFNDSLEVCKRRSKIVNAYRSPASSVKAPQKGYKHLGLLQLSHIRRVLDINETEECRNAFALLVKPAIGGGEELDSLYMFMMVGDDQNKSKWLRTLCKHMANTTCRADSENFLAQIEPQELEISKSDMEIGKFGRAIRLSGEKATKKVGRTFSFNKTPKRFVQRAKSMMSTSMSPLVANSGNAALQPATPQGSEVMGARLASSSSLKVMSPVNHLPPFTPKRIKSMAVALAHSAASARR
ncbi:protein ECT2-like [Ptychodera flava]|uniref:protein ECT2-like n=1 Tax=Ptychodera flava TaxID=63121 RepID=UPI00396A6081